MAYPPGCLTGRNGDPVFRLARAKKAAEAARLAHWKRALERAGHLHPVDAYREGVRSGYKRAAAYWKAKMLRQMPAKAS